MVAARAKIRRGQYRFALGVTHSIALQAKMLLLNRWQRQQMWLCCALCFRQPKMTRYHRFSDPLCADVCILVCRGLQQARLYSLEGCTLSNRGQRPRIAATHSVSAWRAVRPRRWRREPPRRRRTLRGCDGLKAQSNPTKEGLRPAQGK